MNYGTRAHSEVTELVHVLQEIRDELYWIAKRINELTDEIKILRATQTA